LVLASSSFGLFNTYFSPIIDNGNAQVTYKTWQSLKWFYDNKSPLITTTLDQLTHRAPEALYGKDVILPSKVGKYRDAPVRLNYLDNLKLKDFLKNDFYLVLNERELAVKKIISPNSGYFTLDDLTQVRQDSNNFMIYSSYDNDIFLVNTGNQP